MNFEMMIILVSVFGMLFIFAFLGFMLVFLWRKSAETPTPVSVSSSAEESEKL